MSDLGLRLREAREADGLTLAAMASRTGYSDRYLGNVETGRRRVTPQLIRAYEQVLSVDRRSFLLGIASASIQATPDGVAVDVFRDIASERTKLLSTVQTSHSTDRAIGNLVAQDPSSLASLSRWSTRGPAILRVNSVGILAKLGSPRIDSDAIRSLKADAEVRSLYLSAVVSRVLKLPWGEARNLTKGAGPLAELSHVEAFAKEIANPYDSGARWCSLIMLSRTRHYDHAMIDPALHDALRAEHSSEMLRSIGGVLAGLDPVKF